MIVTQPAVTYPDIADNTTNINLTPFKISIAPNFVCGSPINFTITLKSDQLTSTNNFQLATGQPLAPVTFSNSTPVNIPDNDPAGASSFITVSNFSSAVTKATVSLFLTHTFDADLTLELISPDGVTNILSANNGSSGDNYGLACSPASSRTTFDDSATNSIGGGFPPFIGSFVPQAPLAIFNGKSGTNLNGPWALHVIDSAAQDVGVIQCWSLSLTPAQCTDGGGECPGSDLALGMTAAPDPVVLGNLLTYTISLTNNGPSQAKNTVVSHVLPPSVVFQSATTSQGGYSQNGGTVSINFGNLNARSRATATVLVLPTLQGVISSSASASSDQLDPDTSNNAVTLQTHVNPPTADVGVSISGFPQPSVTGGNLAYTIQVTNYGPSAASGVTVTNVLPASMPVLSSTISQGSISSSANIIVCSFNTLLAGGIASAVVNVVPTAEGTFVASASATANQLDPNPSNNTASFTSTIAPSADMAISLVSSASSIVTNTFFTNIVTVVNNGPSIASTVIMNGLLSPAISIASVVCTNGTITTNGSQMSVDLGSMVPNQTAVITLGLTSSSITNAVPLVYSVAAAQGDPNPANNTVATNITVDVPRVLLVASGASLIQESLTPTNGAVDIGETVKVQLFIRNSGNISSPLLSAVLQNTNGVTPTISTQSIVGLAPGATTSGIFGFTAGGTNGGSVTAVLQLFSGGSPATNNPISYVFGLPNVITFANTNSIAIRDNTSALPYPATITISGVTGVVGKVAVTLSNISHTFPEDIDALVVGPFGQDSILMAGAGAPPLTHANVTFDDTASSTIPDGSGGIASGSYRPFDYIPGLSLPSPAPGVPSAGAPYPAVLATFNGANPNGTWSLYVDDHTSGDTGSIAGGWSIALTQISPVNQLADLALLASGTPNPCLAGSNLTYTFTITNAGPNTANNVTFNDILPGGLTPIGGGSGTISTNLGTLAPHTSATLTVSVRPTAANAGSLNNSASISTSDIDLNLANNSASVVTTVSLPVVDLAVTQLASTNRIVAGSNILYTITVTNRGPQNALNVLVTDPLPAGMSSIFVTNPLGSFAISSGTVSATIPVLPAASSATVNILGAAPIFPAFYTNTVTITTGSSDTNAANNSASTVLSVESPAPNIVAAGSILLDEQPGPRNGTIDPGETVTISLGLKNVGVANASSVSATLLAGGGVTPTGTTQKSYGSLPSGGAAVSQTFSFVASGTNGGAISATLAIVNGATALSNVVFNFKLPNTQVFSNSAAITIPDHGAAVPYPSTIAVSGLTGIVSKAKVTLYGVSHTFPRDINALLVSPSGGNVLLMSHSGGAHAITNLTLSFDDAVTNSLSAGGPLASGTNMPTAYPGSVTFPGAPVPPYGSTLNSVVGNDPTGNWSLYVFDDSVGDGGVIASGWSLEVTVLNPVNPLVDLRVTLTSLPSSFYVGGSYTNFITVVNAGASTASGVSLIDSYPVGVTVISNQPLSLIGGGSISFNLGNLSAGQTNQIPVAFVPTIGGFFTNIVTVSANETDLDIANNSAVSVVHAQVPVQALLASPSVSNNAVHLSITVEPTLVYSIQVSSNLSTWVTLTNTSSANGTIKYTDTTASGSSARFYRAKRVIP
ncbi:MAG TPA: proprotein convertase P-domain-containing protein [Candidatus Dormibacteraeota bacterium]|nr:proprotein convertase P-domain-containing protein [Candidatus Dormibacteraeota bacterium]